MLQPGQTVETYLCLTVLDAADRIAAQRAAIAELNASGNLNPNCDLSDYAAADVLKDLLPILDNFERALQAPAGPDTDAFRKGIELIHKQMLDLLQKRGVTPIEALGSDFDPNFHQAVIHEPSTAHREGEVMEELQRGYLLGERLLRPAMVKVAKES